jgi:alanyl-tRNA synthetase
MKHKLQELKISDQTFEKCVARLSYFPTTSAMHDLKHNFEMVQELYDKLIIDHSKYLFQSDIDIVKNTKPIVSQSKKLQILVVENVNNKAINQFLGQENVNNSQAIVILNKLNNKLQYFSISNSANQDLSAKEIVNEINKISHGKGGGKTYYAQGGSDDVNLLSDILSYLKGL